MKSVFVAILLCLMTIGNGYCQSSYSDGFRGIAWGTSKGDLPDLGLSKKTLKNIYEKGESASFLNADRTTLAMEFENVPLISIFLRFNDAKFYGFDLIFKPQHGAEVKKGIATYFSTPGKMIDGEMHWQEDGVTAILTDHELMVSKK
ncbi:MAG: hypothetical protein WBB23_07610 [Desulforhopalus sp.]